MKTYRVTVVRMVECTVLVEAESSRSAYLKAKSADWVSSFNDERVDVEVVGEPEEINEGDE